MNKVVPSLLMAASALLAQAATEYFPLQVGNQWVYRSAQRIGAESLVVEVTGVRQVAGAEYFVVTGFPGDTLLMRYNEEGTLRFRTETTEERTWVPFQANVGEAFATGIDQCNPTAVIRSKQATLRSPLGTFSNGLEVGYRPGNCADAGLTQETYLPGIGLSERRSTSFTGERVLELVYAKLGGGYVVVSAPETSFTTSVDAVGAPGTAGRSMTVRMTLRHTGPTPLRLTFPSGQTFDIQIRNASGETVYTWSADKSFIQVIREITIQGEKNWVEVLPPLDLRAGEYTLTGFLTTTGKRFESTVTFTVP